MNNTPTLRAVLNRVQAWVLSQPRAKRHIAAKAGIAPNTLARVEAPDWRPSIDTLFALEALIPPGWSLDAVIPAEPAGAPVSKG